MQSSRLMNWPVAYHCLFHVGLHLERQPTRRIDLTQLIGSQIQVGRRPVAYHYLFHVGDLDRINEKPDLITLKYR